MTPTIWADPDARNFLALRATNDRHREWAREDERAMRYGDAEPVPADEGVIACTYAAVTS